MTDSLMDSFLLSGVFEYCGIIEQVYCTDQLILCDMEHIMAVIF